MKTLFREVRSEQNIFSAWRHVKRSALNSDNAEIRGMASEFEHAHQRHLKRIITQLRDSRYRFDPVKGVLKDQRKRQALGKQPRPIAIATLKSRIVQRAILQVLQPRTARDIRDIDTKYETKVDERLGKINDVNQSEFGVGGLIHPYGGVRPAIERITKAIDNGAKYYYQSDIKSFFTKIPTAPVINFVRDQTGDHELADLFAEALSVHLKNKDELRGYADLFPKNGIGVAQGSSLSAFAGNVLLYNLDHELNAMDVTAVRYIDDILMVAANEHVLKKAVGYAEKRLAEHGLGLYSPLDGSEKAAQGECSQAISFLGCTIQPNRCIPSAASIAKLKQTLTEAISASKEAINEYFRTGKDLAPKLSQSATLEALGKKINGWQKAFSFCTNDQPFQLLDKYIATQVANYQGFISRKLRKADMQTQMMVLGIPSTQKSFLADRKNVR